MSSETTRPVPSERAQHILRVLVEHYIRDGQPVGSRTLALQAGLDLSPATIRNVMADLEDLGFITSPHTSAGRIPTARGYRFFVDTLVRLQPLAEQEVAKLQTRFEERQRGDAKSIVTTASSLLSGLTSLAGVVTLPRQSHVTLRQIEFLPLSGQRVLAILVVNDAEVQNRILDMPRDYSEDELRRAANYLNQQFHRSGYQRCAHPPARGYGCHARVDEPPDAGYHRRGRQGSGKAAVNSLGYVLSGETQLMNFHELSDVEKIKHLFEAFGEQREILTLLDRSLEADGVQIFIGEESGYRMLDNCTIVAAPYSVDEHIVGVLGVIGPTRMAYERVIPIVDITARLVGAALNSSS